MRTPWNQAFRQTITSLVQIGAMMLATSNSFAEVNMKDANYSRTWIDLELTSGTERFSLRRSYDSRSTFSGLFGFGWCSELDASLEFSNGRKAQLKDCAASRGSSEESLVERVGSSYEFKRADGAKLVFDPLGRLTAVTPAPGNPREASYRLFYQADGTLARLVVFGRALDVSADALTGRIRRIHFDDRRSPEYGYERENLIRARNAWGSDYLYAYDDLHNLRQVIYPDGSKERLTYQPDLDRVVRFENRAGCIDSYTYLILRPAPNEVDRLRSIVERDCGSWEKDRTIFDFWHRTTSSGLKVLAKVRIQEADGTTNEIEYPAADRRRL